MDDGIAVGRRFVVVDLHLHRSVIAGLDEVGKQMGWVRIDNDPAAASCSTIAKEWLAAPPVPPRLPELEADHHNRRVDDAGEQVLRGRLRLLDGCFDVVVDSSGGQ